MYHIRGRVTREEDPMYDPTNDRIHKVVESPQSLADSLVRWTKLQRTITSVVEVVESPIIRGREWPELNRFAGLTDAILANYPLLRG